MNKQADPQGRTAEDGRRIDARRVAQVGILGLTTLGALYLALNRRDSPPPDAFKPFDLSRISVDPFALGIKIQGVIVPLVLIYLLSRTATCRRVMDLSANRSDRLKFAAMLIFIQLVSLAYELAQFNLDWTTFGLFLIVVGAFLGGWKTGLLMGLLVTFIGGTFTYIHDAGAGGLVFVLQRPVPPGMPLVSFWRENFDILVHESTTFYLFNLRASMATWAALVAGMVTSWVKGRWLSPAIAFALGAGIELASGLFVAVQAPAPSEFLGLLLASTLITGMSLAAVALMIRSAQAEVARAKAAEAELAIARAELRALRAQIKPHFLFNALNTIRYFVRTDPDSARQLLLNLSEVFQRAIRSGEFVPLRDELSCVQAYLSLEQARLGERLKVTWTGVVTDPQQLLEVESPLLSQMVPTLSVQPVVENAVVHGVAKKPEGGSIQIAVEQIGSDISIRIADDGKGIEPARLAEILQPPAAGDTSIGLRNVDGRLRALYGKDHGLEIQSEVGRGTCTQIKIPVERNQ